MYVFSVFDWIVYWIGLASRRENIYRLMLALSMMSMVVSPHLYAQGATSLVLGQAESEYGAAIHRDLNQALVLGEYRLVRGVFLADVRARNGAWTLTLTYAGRTLFEFQHNINRQKNMPSAALVVEAIISRLESSGLAAGNRQ